jgi:hypothetical protein
MGLRLQALELIKASCFFRDTWDWRFYAIIITFCLEKETPKLVKSTGCITMKMTGKLTLLRHVDSMLCDDSEVGGCTAAVARWRPRNSNRGTVFSVLFVQTCYKLDKLEVSVVVSCCLEKLVVEAGDSSRTQRKANFRRWKQLPSNG